MTDDPDLTAELDRIAAETRIFGASGEDTTRLLAAVGAVLKLTGDLENLGTAPPSGCEDEAAALGVRWLAAKVREAVTRELNGGGDSGA